MPTMRLSQGKEAIVSEEDFEYLSQWKWHCNASYAARGHKRPDGKKRLKLMHRVIVERMTGAPIPKGYEVDHADGNPLDNQRENLRPVTRSQNNMNGRSRQGTTSQYKGVCWESRYKKWRAYISKDGVRTELGLFKDEKEAAQAYDAKAKELFGEFARLNFPE